MIPAKHIWGRLLIDYSCNQYMLMYVHCVCNIISNCMRVIDMYSRIKNSVKYKPTPGKSVTINILLVETHFVVNKKTKKTMLFISQYKVFASPF